MMCFLSISGCQCSRYIAVFRQAMVSLLLMCRSSMCLYPKYSNSSFGVLKFLRIGLSFEFFFIFFLSLFRACLFYEELRARRPLGVITPPANWGFFQLRTFITYKAKLLGIPVVFVDPRNTSRECPECGYTGKENRKTRDNFLCVSCGHAGPSDAIAALNIRARALVNVPMVAGKCVAISHVSSVTSPRTLTVGY